MLSACSSIPVSSPFIFDIISAIAKFVFAKSSDRLADFAFISPALAFILFITSTESFIMFCISNPTEESTCAFSPIVLIWLFMIFWV
jgi:hypothetical protein